MTQSHVATIKLILTNMELARIKTERQRYRFSLSFRIRLRVKLGDHMKHTLIAACALMATASAFAGNVGVSVTVGQPGFYGRIDIGNYPPPVVVYSQPVVIAPAPVAVVQQPIYLRVPPGQAKKWAKHCAKYNACGQPVYFVQETWYQNVYVPSYKQHGGHDQDDKDHDQGDRKGGGKHKDKHKDKHGDNDQG